MLLHFEAHSICFRVLEAVTETLNAEEGSARCASRRRLVVLEWGTDTLTEISALLNCWAGMEVWSLLKRQFDDAVKVLCTIQSKFRLTALREVNTIR
jgi:hypothetical protein